MQRQNKYISAALVVLALGTLVLQPAFTSAQDDDSNTSDNPLSLRSLSGTNSVISSACASCSSIGFFLISTFGSAGILASTIMSNYQTPIRLIAIGLLLWALYSLSNKLTKSCIIETDYNVGIDKDRKTKL